MVGDLREDELREELDAAKSDAARARLDANEMRYMLEYMLEASRAARERVRGELKERLNYALSEPHRLVHAFASEVAGTPPPGGPPRVPSDEKMRLRLTMMTEEFFETLWACFDADDPGEYQCEMRQDVDDARSAVMKAIGALRLRVDLPEFIDGIADQVYILEGAALDCGVHLPPVFAEVHRANMAKRGAPVVAGKLRKPPGWTPPDIEGELRKQGWTA